MKSIPLCDISIAEKYFKYVMKVALSTFVRDN